MTSDSPKQVPLFNSAGWTEPFENAFLEEPKLADEAARLCHELLTLIESGPDGIREAREALWNAIRLLFPFTEAAQTSRREFEASLAKGLDRTEKKTD